MTIRNLDLYIASLWDWGAFDRCFGGTMIRISDLDGIVERNGKLLIIEGKSENRPIPTGQRIMFEKLVDTGYFSILVAWGEPNNPTKLLAWDQEGKEEFNNADIDTMKGLITRWYRWADGKNGNGWDKRQDDYPDLPF